MQAALAVSLGMTSSSPAPRANVYTPTASMLHVVG
jgi:hypothetical protein